MTVKALPLPLTSRHDRLEKILSDAGWFHWSGIAASLSQEGADACLEALQTADRLGLTISCDLNFRKKLSKLR